MRPYWAIIKDSFREAMQSRVLLLLLSITTVLLVGLAPIGLSEQLGGYFLAADLLDQKGLLAQIERQRKADKPSPGKQIWREFSESFKKRLGESNGGESNEKESAKSQPRIELLLPKELNRVIQNPQLYDEAAWSGARLSGRAKDLLERGTADLSPEELSHLNRLLLEAAYPGKIARGQPAATYLSYFAWRVDGAFPVSKSQFAEAIISAFVTVFVGIIGVFVAILVTASIIPQTFAPGAIDLLLSKPISRSLLYATKYLGGCMFTLINASYVIFGMWLIAGLRFGEWSYQLLLCIPIFLFLFAIYYAVSALAGAVWRNAIVSVVVTILFWGLCWALGATKSAVEGFWIDPQRFVAIVPAGESLVAANQRGRAFRWDELSHDWREILTSAEERGQRGMLTPMPPLVGPVYDAAHQRITAIYSPYSPFGAVPGGNLLRVGQRNDDWQLVLGAAVPSGTSELFMSPQSDLLAVGSQGVFRLQGDPTEAPKQVEMFGIRMPAAGQGAKFKLVSPASRLHSPLSASIDGRSGAIALFDGQTLQVLAFNESQRYVEQCRRKFDFDEQGVVALAQNTVLIGLADGRVLTFDAAELKPLDEYEPCGRDSVRSAAASPDGQYFAVAFEDGKLWVYDAQARSELKSAEFARSDVSAVAFAPTGNLLVAGEARQVVEIDLPDANFAQRYVPSRSYVELADHFLLKPLYAVFPKPGELGTLTNHLLQTADRAGRRNRPRGLQQQETTPDLWGPVGSNLAFIVVAVALGCWYTARRDF